MRRTKKTLATLLTLGLITGLGLTAVPPQVAEACGGFFCAQVPVDQAGERILFEQDGDTVSAYVQVQYQGEADKFSWVVPVPSEPTLSVGSDQLFTVLRNATRPQFRLDQRTEGECESNIAQGGGNLARSGALQPESAVDVVSRQEVGPYDSVVLQSEDPQALKTWLRENGYDIPQTLDPLLDPYVNGKYYFVALKLLSDRSTGDLQPIVLKYKADRPGIPIRLTGVAATEDMDVYAWVLGQHRAIPENFRHAQINEARIDWLSGGSNYRQVVTEAMNEAGGQAFVTDYAGESSTVNTDQFDPSRFDTQAIATLTEPVAFIRAVSNGGFFQRGSAQAMSFFERYVPKPASAEAVAGNQFYNALINGGPAFTADGQTVDVVKLLADAQVVVEAEKAAGELEQTVVQPFRDIRAMFQRHPYMTALYTTMSPSEMTQDPTFLYNPDLPKVSNMHEAKGVRECGPGIQFFEAPVKITLTNGISFYATRSTGGGSGTPAGDPIAMPAAWRIEQLKTTGQASVIKSNDKAIKEAIDTINQAGAAIAVSSSGAAGATGAAGTSTTVRVPRRPGAASAAGFGCTGCASPNRATPPMNAAVGEFYTYGLLLLGFLGWRRFNRRKEN